MALLRLPTRGGGGGFGRDLGSPPGPSAEVQSTSRLRPLAVPANIRRRYVVIACFRAAGDGTAVTAFDIYLNRLWRLLASLVGAGASSRLSECLPRRVPGRCASSEPSAWRYIYYRSVKQRGKIGWGDI